MSRVRTCVYTISLNEIKHVDLFMDACKGADLVLVCDTGSRDGTVERLKERGAVVYQITQKPWRFDVPRNTALNLVPLDIDICLSIDLDEYLQPGWVEAINRAWQENNGHIDRIAYDYVWNWVKPGVPGIRFNADKIHHRKNYVWKHPCHETLYYQGPNHEKRIVAPDIHLHHHADSKKSRGQYLHLLAIATDEDPSNDRMAHYYARELMYGGHWEKAIAEFKRHIDLFSAAWLEERCASMRYMSRCYRNMGKKEEAVKWAIKAAQEWPYSREPWLELARAAHAALDWHTVYWAATKCLSIKERTSSYMSDPDCWGHEPYDQAAMSAYYLGLHDSALEHGLRAVQFQPSDERLQKNLDFYLEKQR
jgi:glycosyltransferase involved in cell wall biosynthesis